MYKSDSIKSQSMEYDHKESFLYEITEENYHPLWYDRSNDWTGQTYDKAVDFCVNTKYMSLCPYEVYCPMAELDVPI